METKTTNRQELAWESLPRKESGSKIAGKKEGFHLANSVTEDVGGFSLMPAYSDKQQRSIHKRKRMVQRQQEILAQYSMRGML